MEEDLEKIAKNILSIDTLDTQKSDQKDFHDLSVWSIKRALEEAYVAGKNSAVETQVKG